MAMRESSLQYLKRLQEEVDKYNQSLAKRRVPKRLHFKPETNFNTKADVLKYERRFKNEVKNNAPYRASRTVKSGPNKGKTKYYFWTNPTEAKIAKEAIEGRNRRIAKEHKAWVEGHKEAGTPLSKPSKEMANFSYREPDKFKTYRDYMDFINRYQSYAERTDDIQGAEIKASLLKAWRQEVFKQANGFGIPAGSKVVEFIDKHVSASDILYLFNRGVTFTFRYAYTAIEGLEKEQEMLDELLSLEHVANKWSELGYEESWDTYTDHKMRNYDPSMTSDWYADDIFVPDGTEPW